MKSRTLLLMALIFCVSQTSNAQAWGTTPTLKALHIASAAVVTYGILGKIASKEALKFNSYTCSSGTMMFCSKNVTQTSNSTRIDYECLNNAPKVSAYCSDGENMNLAVQGDLLSQAYRVSLFALVSGALWFSRDALLDFVLFGISELLFHSGVRR